MPTVSELRYRATRVVRWLNAILALVVLLLLTLVVISGFLLYGAVSPPKLVSDINLGLLLGHPGTLNFALPDGKSREGWFFPGLKRAPTIVVCHGYRSQRGDLLTLVTTLQSHQYNVFLFDFSGHGTSPGRTALGYDETGELLAAIEMLSKRPDLDPSRIGLWGTNMGGYAALSAATMTDRVRALAVASVYDSPLDMLRLQISHSGLSALPLVERFCEFGFKLLNFPYRHQPPLSQRIEKLAGVSKLFIVSNEGPVLAKSTLELFLRSPEPREQAAVQKTSYTDMSDDEKRAYEGTVVNFFLRTLPPTRSFPH